MKLAHNLCGKILCRLAKVFHVLGKVWWGRLPREWGRGVKSLGRWGRGASEGEGGRISGRWLDFSASHFSLSLFLFLFLYLFRCLSFSISLSHTSRDPQTYMSLTHYHSLGSHHMPPQRDRQQNRLRDTCKEIGEIRQVPSLNPWQIFPCDHPGGRLRLSLPLSGSVQKEGKFRGSGFGRGRGASACP